MYWTSCNLLRYKCKAWLDERSWKTFSLLVPHFSWRATTKILLFQSLIMGDEQKNEKAVKHKIDSNDPQFLYYLCSSDNSGNTICPVSLNRKNYANWSRLATNGLKSKNKVGFIDGSLTWPDITSLDFHAWEKCNAMVIAWLYNVIDKSLHRSIAYAGFANVIW